MKKILIIISVLFIQIAYSNSSNNSFEIELKEVPKGSSKTHKGLSDGAISAITLGSTFGGLGALSFIGYYFLNHSKGLACGFACGEEHPYQLVDNLDFILKTKHSYLIKAYKYAPKDKNYKYLVIPDTKIKPNTYNTVFFELPKSLKNASFKIIQSSSFLNSALELDTDIFSTEENITKIPTNNPKLKKGLLIKQGEISADKRKIFALSTSYKSTLMPLKTYAIIVVFE